jgi:4-amino-4-deoxy-L-arabinose transferase-like glycosyltransferase
MTLATGPDSGARMRPDAFLLVAEVLPATRWLVILLLPFAVIKGGQFLLAAPTPDEAYYWLWGQHLSLSYYDHPPLTAWMQRVAAELFGWNRFSLRVMTLASFAGCLAILWYWARRLAGRQPAFRVFLGGLIAWLSVPMVLRYQGLAHPDHWLILFGVATAHFWALFIERLEAGEKAWRFYYAGCVALGFAGLSKYNAVFIGAGFAAWVFLSPVGRRLLASPHLWLGGALAAAMQAPVLIWNTAHDWPSMQYNLQDRIGLSDGGGFADNLTRFAVSSAIMASPLLLIAVARFLGPRRSPFQPVGRAVFAVSTLSFVALCATNTVLSYWNLAAYLFVLPAALIFIGSRLEFALHALYGISVAAWLIGANIVYPSYKAAGNDVRDNDITFGTAEIAAIVAEEEARLGPQIVATTDYRTAALLSLAGKRLDVVNLGPRGSQFDFWFDPAAHRGEDALVLVDDFLGEDRGIIQAFESVTPVREIEIRRFGYTMHRYRLVHARDYSGERFR